ncbi:hypothetical protein P3T27_008093 [Kitasatospora sp. MAA19]|uniref:hypothetical protein n=1 Tax=unclassified Kitasatospora TaxID=2633591 RepID=UPI0024739521|nr:hypothetical protein [Kitasatospora sp. MAA19]MDH6711335.1 hypothetical protein [Kitasatospora sp. MAA19]
MTQQRRGSRQVAARERATQLAAEFAAAEKERIRIAQEYLVAQGDIDDFDAETERRVADLREQRGRQLAAKRGEVEALVVEMLDTGVSQQEAAARLGLTPADVRAAKRSYDAAVARLAAESIAGQAGPSPEASPETAPAGAAGASAETGSPEADGASYQVGPVAVPHQEGPGDVPAGATQPPGSAV